MNTKHISVVNGVSGKNRRSFMFALVLAGMLALGASQAFARGDKNGGYYGAASGGYSGPGPAVVTVEQAKGMGDDARVALRGHIIQSLGGEDYVFKDDTGTVTVEISNKRWQGQTVGPNDLVEIYGEVDKEWSTLEIDVKRIIKQ